MKSIPLLTTTRLENFVMHAPDAQLAEADSALAKSDYSTAVEGYNAVLKADSHEHIEAALLGLSRVYSAQKCVRLPSVHLSR